MQISAANNSLPTRPIEPKAPTAAPAEAPVPSSENISLRRVAALLTMLENKPEIRPEVLARGRALASDPTYPAPDIVTKLAGLMVN